jgi:hypothetical protein
MKSFASTAAVFLGATLVLAAGCVEPPADTESEGVGDNVLSFEELEAGLAREKGTGHYIVEGDIVIPTREMLQDYFEAAHQPGALAIQQSWGFDTRWSDTEKVNLSYCVSTAFGSNYDLVKTAMATAAADWEHAGYVNFVHRSEFDGSCEGNGNVLFDVRPTSGQDYLARAFFPNWFSWDRHLFIDSTAFASIVPMAGILRHELGHVLGFVHEHIRPEASPTGDCGEIAFWRGVTSYDPSSVMHYMQCGPSTVSASYPLSPQDEQGIALVYGDSPCQRASDTYGIHAHVNFGFAPADVQSWWTTNGCDTQPRQPLTCQWASDTYGIDAGVTFGFAPPELQTWWQANGCNTHPVSATTCQKASNTYGIHAGVTWGFAPAYVQTWWQSTGCNTAPSGPSTCQKASNRYAVDADVTWGFSPADVRTWWQATGCTTRPQ